MSYNYEQKKFIDNWLRRQLFVQLSMMDKQAHAGVSINVGKFNWSLSGRNVYSDGDL